MAGGMPAVELENAIRECAVLWGLNEVENGMEMAADWHHQVKDNSYFATGFMIPYRLNNEYGVLLAASTAQSTRVCHENMELYTAGGVIDNPHWLYYELWWFPSMAMFQRRV